MVQITGWQEDLVKRNPNLSRWHWHPVYIYKQGILNRNKSKAAPGRKAGTPKYELPVSADTTHYIKPIHLPNHVQSGLDKAVSADLLPKEATESLSGQLGSKGDSFKCDCSTNGFRSRRLFDQFW